MIPGFGNAKFTARFCYPESNFSLLKPRNIHPQAAEVAITIGQGQRTNRRERTAPEQRELIGHRQYRED